jgi:hypothetical protein
MIDRTLPAPPLERDRPNVSTLSRAGMTWLRYIDVVLVLLAAPVVLLAGASAAGYGVGVAAWIGLRAVGLVVDRSAGETGPTIQQVTLRLGYRLTRVFLLAMAVILARRTGGKHDGLAALLVILVAFTIQLTVSIIDRPASHH